ncbi:MAG: TetR/AcrR family transcriptional regulator [Lachnospiraceae bacterium]|nr:TetR/AcrR family transcriptional regulator [Lachnospiraceae bacterium]
MPRDKTVNHVKIMAAARAEFLEMGFEKASMRSIAARCDMTAAGIYRHCENKEDLFYQLVAPAKESLAEWGKQHKAGYEEPIKIHKDLLWKDSYIDMARELIYPNMEDYYLLIVCSKGTKYEHFLNDMTKMAQTEILQFMDELRKQGYDIPKITESQLHLLLTAYITALFEPVVHSYRYEEAMDALSLLEEFFLPGWKTLMGFNS